MVLPTNMHALRVVLVAWWHLIGRYIHPYSAYMNARKERMNKRCLRFLKIGSIINLPLTVLMLPGQILLISCILCDDCKHGAFGTHLLLQSWYIAI